MVLISNIIKIGGIIILCAVLCFGGCLAGCAAACFLHKQIKNEVDNGVSEISFFNNMEYHPCLVGKITLFENGDVGICPMMPNNTFGNVLDNEFENIVNKENLYPYWKSSINKISQCKECEYRFTCKDCRAIENYYNKKDKFICVKNFGRLK